MKRARFWIGIGISIVSLILAFQGIHFKDILAALRGAVYIWLIPAWFLIVIAQVARAARWGLLFYPRRDLALSKLFAILSIGYLLSNVLPARAGDIARAYLIGDAARIPLPRALSTIVVERVFDVLTVVLFLVVLVPFVPLPTWVIRSAQVLGVGFLGLVAALLLVSWQRARGLKLAAWGLGFIPWLDTERWVGHLGSLIEGFDLLRMWRPLIELILWSLGIWTSGAVVYYWTMQAFGITLPFQAAVFVLCVAALGVMVPSSPGYVGVFHYAVVLALTVFGITKDQALSYALVLHGVNYITLVALGFLFAARESISVLRLESEIAGL